MIGLKVQGSILQDKRMSVGSKVQASHEGGNFGKM